MFAGSAQIWVDGKMLATTADSAELEPGGQFYETVSTFSRVLGHNPAPVQPGKVKGDFITETSADAVKLMRARGVTVIFAEDNGQKWVINNAAQVGKNPNRKRSGDMGMRLSGIEFEGQPAEPTN
jgi:hypothetical protein